MKELTGSASAVVAASLPQCVALLRDLERYPRWHPEVVREVEVLERNGSGQAIKASAMLRFSAGPLVKELPMLLAVGLELPAVVKLTRLPYDPADQEQLQLTWRVEDQAQAVLHVALQAALEVPRLVPLRGLGDSVAGGFVAAARTALTQPEAQGPR